MENVVFDTLAYANRLKAVGVPEEQAEVQVEILAEIIESNLATKHDIAGLQRDMKELEVALKRDIKELEVSLKRDIKELELTLKHDLTLRFGGMLTVAVGILAILMKIL